MANATVMTERVPLELGSQEMRRSLVGFSPHHPLSPHPSTANLVINLPLCIRAVGLPDAPLYSLITDSVWRVGPTQFEPSQIPSDRRFERSIWARRSARPKRFRVSELAAPGVFAHGVISKEPFFSILLATILPFLSPNRRLGLPSDKPITL